MFHSAPWTSLRCLRARAPLDWLKHCEEEQRASFDLTALSLVRTQSEFETDVARVLQASVDANPGVRALFFAFVAVPRRLPRRSVVCDGDRRTIAPQHSPRRAPPAPPLPLGSFTISSLFSRVPRKSRLHTRTTNRRRCFSAIATRHLEVVAHLAIRPSRTVKLPRGRSDRRSRTDPSLNLRMVGWHEWPRYSLECGSGTATACDLNWGTVTSEA